MTTWVRSQAPFILLVLLGFFTLFFSVWGVIFNKDWIIPVAALYIIWIFLALILIFSIPTKPIVGEDTIEEFEKTLKGRLYHFKCPNCNGIFAIKKSKHNNKKPFKMTCPDCGEVAVVSPTPRCIEEEIPEKKSVNVNFKCTNCGEAVTIWAEGAELYPYVRVYSCPYCGMEKTMNRILV